LTDDRRQQLRTRLGFFAMCGGTFMAVLDTQIVASSLPEIAAGMGATIEEASWIQTAYLIAEAIMIPLAGWLSRTLTLRYLYALASALFTLMSLLCALSWSIDSLVVVRVFQGLCSGILAPLLYQGIYLLFPRERQVSVTLYVVLIVSFAPIIGPTLGGWITQTWSWHWMFLLNLLPGLLVTAMVFGLIDGEPPNYSLLKQFDLPGVALVALFLGSLEYVLGEGPSKEWFESPVIVCLAATAVLAALLLIWRELSCRHPVIELRAFANRNFATGSFLNLVMGMALFGSGYLMVLFLSRVKGFDSLQVGQVMAVPGVAMLLSMPMVRIARRHLQARNCVAIGLIIFSCALWSNSTMTASTGNAQLFWPQVMRGLAIMFCLGPITELALGRLSLDAVPNASGLYSLMRSLGGGIGIAVVNQLAEQRTALHYWRLAETLNPARFAEELEQLTARFAGPMADLDLGGLGGSRMVARLVRRESLVMAYNDSWLLLAMLTAVLLLLVPLVQKARKS
jgi:DHA2 family multidrug resistance protein